MLGRLFKFIFFMMIFAVIGLVAYTYIGPIFGVDLSAPQSQMTIPVDLDAK